MSGLRLYKREKLCGVTAIDSLFASSWRPVPGVESCFAYPWRAVWRVNGHRDGLCARFLVSVPKKRFKRAVDRVLMRRRGREAYRLNRSLFNSCSSGLDIVFIYVGKDLTPYSASEKGIRRILSTIALNHPFISAESQ